MNCNVGANIYKLTLSGALAVVLVGLGASAADATNHAVRSMRQEYQRQCNEEGQSRKLEGTALRQFVDDCTKSRSQATPQANQQAKTTLCQRRATQDKLQGHDRQHFVEDCANAPTEVSEHHEKILRCSLRATQEKVWGAARKQYVNECISG